MAKKKAVINPHNDDEECFKWAVIAASEIGKDLQHVSNLKEFTDNYTWSGLEFPVTISKISVFERKNDVSITVLALKGPEVYIARKSECKSSKNIDILLITNGKHRHYTAIKSLSRLLGSRNSKHAHKLYFCLNCLQGFHSELSRDKHYNYCKDNEAVKIEMPKPDSFVEFHNGQHQFKIPFMMYADFEAILRPVHGSSPNPNKPYTKEINRHIPSGFCINSKFAYGEVKDPLKLYRGKDCIQVFCDYIKREVRRLYHMFPEKPMEPLTSEEWKGYNQATKCHICFKPFEEINPKVRDHCHYTSKYRGPAHRNCNLRYKIPSHIPVIFHNLSGYDAHLFIRELGKETTKTGVIAENKEKYISFTTDVMVDEYQDKGKTKEKKIQLRFINRFGFMASSLDSLTSNLVKGGKKLTGFEDYSKDQYVLLVRKGVYLYEYMMSWDKFMETQLPPKEAFHNSLNMSDISE